MFALGIHERNLLIFMVMAIQRAEKFSRWSKAGIFRKIFASLAKKCGNRNVAMIDSTFSKAHRTAYSLKSDEKTRAIGKSKGA